MVKVQFKCCGPCTIVYKPEFTIKEGTLGDYEFNTLWKKYMAGETDLHEQYPYVAVKDGSAGRSIEGEIDFEEEKEGSVVHINHEVFKMGHLKVKDM